MSEPEAITLPRSGVRLTRITLHKNGDADFACGPSDDVWLYVHADGVARAGCTGWLSGEPKQLAETLALLDAAVLELRAALMPADAEERVARALAETADAPMVTEWQREKARAVLAALRGDRR